MFKTTLSITSALLIAMSIPAAQASHKKVPNTPPAQAQLVLRDIEGMANRTSADANPLDRLGETLSADAHLQYLQSIKTDVNTMSRDISRLNAEIEVLTPAEKDTVQKVEPLIKETAQDANRAILFFNKNRAGLWRPEYRGYIDDVMRDSGRVAAAVKEYRQTAKSQGEQQHGSEAGGE